MQEVLVELVGSRAAYKLFEFNGATKLLQRHKLIKEFQNDVNDQPCVFIVTCARAPAPNALLQTRCSKRAAPTLASHNGLHWPPQPRPHRDRLACALTVRSLRSAR